MKYLFKIVLKTSCYNYFLFYRQERQHYYTNRQLAIEKPKEVISIIIDGMDQNKTNVPHMIRVPKSCQNSWNLRTHLTGNLVHGRGNYGYFDFLQWPHDCNLTITTMLQTLLQLDRNTTTFQGNCFYSLITAFVKIKISM